MRKHLQTTGAQRWEPGGGALDRFAFEACEVLHTLLEPVRGLCGACLR